MSTDSSGNGPLLPQSNEGIFNDRSDDKIRWYLPAFALKVPLIDSFTFRCHQTGLDSQANPVFSGEATFVVSKTRPAAVQAKLQANDGVTYREIPVDNLAVSFLVTLFNNSQLPYNGQLARNGEEYTLSIKLDTQDSLIAFYKFISRRENASFCKLSVSGSYAGYVRSFKRPPLPPHPFPRPLPRPIPTPHYHPADDQATLHLNPALDREPYRAPATDEVSPHPALMASRAIKSRMFMKSQLQMLQINQGWQQAADPADAADFQNFDVRKNCPFSASIDGVSFDCSDFQNNYLAGSGVAAVPFGCQPPFGDASLDRRTYSFMATGDLTGLGISHIYRNIYNGNFLVVPERYVIALDSDDDDDLKRPAAYLFTSLDPNGVQSSTGTFEFHIAPEVSEHQLVLIKKHILEKVPKALNKTVDDVFIEFPDALGEPQGFDRTRIPAVALTPIGTYRHGPAGSRYFNLQFQNVPLANGSVGWVSGLLKTEGGDNTAAVTITVDCDSDNTPQSAIDLSLTRVCGNAVSFKKGAESGGALVNSTLYAVAVDAWQTPAMAEQILPAPLMVAANRSVAAAEAGFPIGTPQATFRYTVDPGQSRSYVNELLKEIRVVDLNTDVADTIVVTSNTGLFTMFKIASIGFVISIVRPGETDPSRVLYSSSMTMTQDGAINYLQFVLPASQYLSKWSAVYLTVVNFADGRQQVNDPETIDDLNRIGKMINLTPSKLRLQPQPQS